MAFVGSGRIAILSDQEEKRWMYEVDSIVKTNLRSK
jgi:hypothetical protein